MGYTTEKNKYVNSKESIIFDDFTLDAKFVDFPYMVKSSAIKILTLKDVTKDNIRFNFELLSNHKFNMLGHARHYISVVQPEEVFIPNKQEQDKIGELFSNLDNLITLHQRKFNYILSHKLEIKLFFFIITKNVWEQRKLANLINEYKETVTSDCTLPVLTSSKVDGVVLQEEHFGRKQNHDITGYNILPYGYCTYRNRSDGIDFTFNINKCCKMGIISKFYPVFYGNKNNINLISIILNNSKEVAREIGYTCSGTGQKVLSFLDLQKMNIIIPNRSEQDKISDLFDNLDNLITLHQRKCTYIFYSWEQRELFDVADYRNGKAHENDIDNDGKYIVINSKFVSTEGKIKKYSNKQNEPLFQNEIAFVLSDVPNGRAIAKTFLVDKSSKYTLNQRIAGITPHSNINPKFLSITMNRNKYFLQFDDGVKQTNLSLNDMKKFEEFYPNKQEQDKIGDLFTNLDNLITLHQHKELKRRNDNNDNLRW